MKRTLCKLGISLFLSICFTFSSIQAQCLQNFSYQIPITITNPNAVVLTNFQVQLVINTSALVAAGHMQASGADIRFTEGNCCNNLSFTVESGMNTTTTNIWVKVPSIPASGSIIINMDYGNPAATSLDNPNATFDLWEPFDNLANHFSPSCGSGSYGVAGGIGSMGWSSSYIAISDITFDMDTVYTAEMNVTAASGNWPGINFSGVTPGANHGYSMLYGSGLRIGKAGSSAPDYCRGENWASSIFSPVSVVGLWSITWISTGNIMGTFPTLGTLSSIDTEHNRNQDLKLCIGGISGGVGTLDMDWIRVRKYAPMDPSVLVGIEAPLSFMSVSLGPDTTLCNAVNVMFDAGSGFSSYSWSGIASGTSQTANVNGTGQVIIYAVDPSSCPSTDTVNIFEFAPINLNIGVDQTICANDSISLDAGVGMSSYLWSTGGTGQFQNVSDSAIYSVDVVDVNGCTDADTVIVSLYPQPTAGFTGLSAGLTTTFNNTSGGGTSYFWDFDDGNTSTAFDTVHVFAISGTYNVCLTVTSIDGCTETHCNSVTVSNAGINNQFSAAGLKVYPNPAKGNVWIDSNEPLTEMNVRMMDILGKTVFVKSYTNFTTQSIDISSCTPGNYAVEVTIDGKIYYTSLIIIE